MQSPIRWDGQTIEVEGENLTYSRSLGTYMVEGNVRVSGEEWMIEADRVMVDSASFELGAEGNVSMRDEQGVMTGERIWVDLRENTGLIIRGSVVLGAGPGYGGKVQIEGAEIWRVASDLYRVKRGSFTTCDCPGDLPLPWSIRYREADITVGDYARFRGFSFRMFELPVLYSPVLFYPVKTERQTGFLIPHFSYSRRDGFQIEQSFFLAISPPQDATFSLSLMSKRGPRIGGQYRYRITAGFPGGFAGGQMDVNYLRELFDGSGEAEDEEEHQDEWWRIRFTHEHDVTLRDWAGAEVDLVGPVGYEEEFGESIEERTTQNLISSGYWRHRGDRILMLTEVNFVYQLEGSQQEAVHRIPRLLVDFVDVEFPGVPLRFHSPISLVTFARFQDPPEAAPRIHCKPHVSLPLSLGGIAEVNGEIGIHEVAYWVKPGEFDTEGGGDPFRNQTAPYGEAFIESGLIREYLREDGSGWRHQVLGGVGFFQQSLLKEGEVPEIDEVDDIGDRKILPYRISTEIRYRDRPGSTQGKMSLELEEFYDLREREFSDIQGRFLLQWGRWRGEASGIYNFLGKGLTDFGASLAVPLRSWGGFSASYRKLEPLEERGDLNRVVLTDYLYSSYARELSHGIQGGLSINLFQHVVLSGRIHFSIEDSIFQEGSYSISYRSFCECFQVTLTYLDRTGEEEDSITLYTNLLVIEGGWL